MTEKEIARLSIIQNLIDGEIDGTDAAKQLDLSVRHTKRLKAKVLSMGPTGLIHQSHGKSGNRRLPAKIMDRAKNLLRKEYYDFGPTFAAEKLEEEHQIKINKETLRIIMSEMKLWTIKPRKNPKHKHFWRPRKESFGEMQQFDGSYHKWFDQEETCLLLSVDDANGKITHGEFKQSEGVKDVFGFWLGYFDNVGLPVSVYLDKFSTYKINHKNAVDNSQMLTQFQRAMQQIDVKLIVAHSPEAKGRVERMFGTLQDRLVKELRLANIKTVDQANKFLKEYIPKFNTKFAVVPTKDSNLHKPVSQTLKAKLPQIFSVQEERKVNNDYTVMYKTKFFQLNDVQPTTVYKKDAVIVEEHLSGEIKINLNGHYLHYQELPARPKKQIDLKLAAITTRKPNGWKPPLDHPWRQTFIFNKQTRPTSAQTQNLALNAKYEVGLDKKTLKTALVE